MVNALLSADADAVCGAEYGRAGPERLAQRNSYRHWDPGARVGTIDMAVPKLRTGSYFPGWLLERRKLAESVLITVVADAHLVGVSTRRMDKLVGTLGISSELVNALVSTIFAQISREAGRGPVRARHRSPEGRLPRDRPDARRRPARSGRLRRPPQGALAEDPAAAIPSSASTGRSSAKPTSSRSSPTGTPSPA